VNDHQADRCCEADRLGHSRLGKPGLAAILLAAIVIVAPGFFPRQNDRRPVGGRRGFKQSGQPVMSCSEGP
jgi:hypothetical protein